MAAMLREGRERGELRWGTSQGQWLPHRALEAEQELARARGEETHFQLQWAAFQEENGSRETQVAQKTFGYLRQ